MNPLGSIDEAVRAIVREELRLGLRDLAFDLHPDRNGGANVERMKQLNSAFQSISKERGFQS